MQHAIHPKQNQVNVTCSCGNTFVMESTYAGTDLHIELCYKCHPAYTGKRRIIEAGAVSKFEKRYGKMRARNTKKTTS